MQQYYAHPQNAFWKIITKIFAREVAAALHTPSENPDGATILRVWDVLAAAERPGSLDSSIVHASARANDFARFYRAHPHIRRVFFNGRKAEEMYRRFVLPGLSSEFAVLRYECMPSTSPAHAGMTFARS